MFKRENTGNARFCQVPFGTLSWPVQYLSHLCEELRGTEGLLQKIHAFLQNTVMRNGIRRVTRDIEDSHLRGYLLKSSCKVLSAHSWHHDVGNQQLDLDGVRPYTRQGLLSTRGLDDDVPRLLQCDPGNASNRGIVVYQEYCFGAPRGSCARRFHEGLVGLLG